MKQVNILILCLLMPLFIGNLLLAEEKKDIFKGLSRGDRTSITLKNGSVLTGEIKVILKDDLVLDISYDDPTLRGTVTLSRPEIKGIEVLKSLSSSKKNEVKQKKRKRLKEYIKETRALKKAAGRPAEGKKISPSTELSEEGTEAELLELLEKFPPEQGWGEEKQNEILDKNPAFRTEEEDEFLEKYNRWLEALELTAKEDRKLLLEKFPPAEDENDTKGWSEKKYQELSTKFIRIDVPLTAEEQEFTDNFEDWKKALREKVEEDRRKEEAEEKKKKASPPSSPQRKIKNKTNGIPRPQIRPLPGTGHSGD